MFKSNKKELTCCQKIGYFLVVLILFVGITTSLFFLFDRVSSFCTTYSEVQTLNNVNIDTQISLKSLTHRVEDLQQTQTEIVAFIGSKKWNEFVKHFPNNDLTFIN